MAQKQNSSPFNLIVEVNEILMNKPRPEGTFEAKDSGATIEFKHAVQMRLQALRKKYNDAMEQEVDYIDELIIEIPCSSIATIKSVLQFLDRLKLDKSSFSVPVVIKNTGKVTSIYKDADLVNYIQAQLKAS